MKTKKTALITGASKGLGYALAESLAKEGWALLINARDDPFFPGAALPWQRVSQNPFLTAEFPQAGGHAGFISGRWPGRSTYWAEQRAMGFLDEQLSRAQEI